MNNSLTTMEQPLNDTGNEVKQPSGIPTISTVLSDGEIVEMVYLPDEKRTAFVLWHNDTWRYEASVKSPSRLVPYSPDNNLVKNEVVLFPSQPQEYESEEQLISEVQDFIHRYVDVSPLFEKIASYYVLFSWVYDSFNELPYLRVRADYGGGKTRFLLTIGSLCYKPIFASGASTVSPLFRIIDAFRGTLIIDEGDFRLSDERAEIVKILNNGNARGFPVLRSEVTPKREFNPTAYTVFGPKLVATRGFFQDRALESRCITEQMGLGRLREEIPINLPASFKQEALSLRNKLLMFRFRNAGKLVPDAELVDRSIEPRLNQVFVPLLSIIQDRKAQDDLRDLMKRLNRDLITERGFDMEAQVLEVIRDILASSDPQLSMKAITSWFADRHGDDYERKITPKWIGNVIRKRLNLKTHKSHGVFVILDSEKQKIERLYEKYGISLKDSDETEGEDGSL